jgi:hypothetical protein
MRTHRSYVSVNIVIHITKVKPIVFRNIMKKNVSTKTYKYIYMYFTRKS